MSKPVVEEKNRVTYKKSYIYYAAMVFGIANLLDIFSSNAGPLIKSYVIEEFLLPFMSLEAAYQRYGLVTAVGFPLAIFAFSLRFIADKYGRKPALLVNIIGMTIGAGLLLWSGNFIVFMIGTFFGNFFLVADIQLLMITEEAPEKSRASFLAFARIIGLVGAIFVPVMRQIFLDRPDPYWRGVFIFPLALGIFVSLLVLFTLKESSVYLTMKKKQDEHDTKQRKRGLFIQAFKTAGIWIIILTAFVGALGTLGGIAEREFMEPFLRLDVGLTVPEINLIYYLRYGISMVLGLVMGIIRDKMGRKIGLIATLVIQCVFLGLFILFINYKLVVWAGISYGLFIYAIFMNSVTAGLIVNEMTPTKTRGTMTIITGLLIFIPIIIWMVVQSLLVGAGVSFLWLMVIATVPFSIIGIIIAIFKVPETKGVDLTTIGEK